MLLLTEDSTCRVLGYVSDQSIQFRERLIAGIAVIVILTFQLAEWPAATLFRPVKRVG